MLKLVRPFTTKAEFVYQSLFDDIIGNTLTPGTRLIVKDIADSLSVSDIPVREALKMLEATGLIEIRPHAGAFVAIPSLEWIEEVFVMRAALESMAIRTAIPYMSDADIDEITEREATMKKVGERGDSVEYARLNREFHHAIMARSPYPNLLAMIDDLLVKSQYGQAIFGLKPASVMDSDLDHNLLISAIRERDIDRAEMITRNHRLRVGRELVEAIPTDSKEGVPEASRKDQ